MRNTQLNRQFFDALVRSRNRSNKDIDSIFQNFKKAKSNKRPSVIKGVHRGQFFRIKVPPRQSILPELPKLPSPIGPALKSFKSVPPIPEQAAVAAQTALGEQARQKREHFRDYFEWLYQWWKENWPVLTMNFGSLCTLLAFTRTDVLELRTLSVSGSVCFIIYTVVQSPIKWLTVGWTALFASVNSFKIAQIVNERHSHVRMTDEQHEVFSTLFMPHGITPKQFELIEKAAEHVVVKKNEPLIRQGERLEHVSLVIQGSTRASILGRYLTAASTTPTNTTTNEVNEGGNAGAWVGEMAFLESYWEKDKPEDTDANKSPSAANRFLHAMYTVVAKEDCIVWRWSHDDMGRLMEKSTDLRAALTRAMTSAIVGKVINFTTSRSSARPTWQTWLDDWKHTKVVTSENVEEDADQDDSSNGNPNEGSPDEGKASPA